MTLLNQRAQVLSARSENPGYWLPKGFGDRGG